MFNFVIPLNGKDVDEFYDLLIHLERAFPGEIERQDAIVIQTEAAHLAPLFHKLALPPAPAEKKKLPEQPEQEPEPEQDLACSNCGRRITRFARSGLCRSCSMKVAKRAPRRVVHNAPAPPDEGEPEYHEASSGTTYTLAEIKRAVKTGSLTIGTVIEHRDGLRYKVALSSKGQRPTLRLIHQQQ